MGIAGGWGSEVGKGRRKENGRERGVGGNGK